MDRNFLLAMILCGVVMAVHTYYSGQLRQEEALKEQQKQEELAKQEASRKEESGTAGKAAGMTDPQTPTPSGTTPAGTEPNPVVTPDAPVETPPAIAQWPTFEPAVQQIQNDVLKVTLDAAGASVTKVELLKYEDEFDEGARRTLQLMSGELLSGRAFVLQVPGAENLPIDAINWKAVPAPDGENGFDFHLPLPGRGGEKIVKSYRLRDAESYLLDVKVDWPASMVGSQYRFLGPERLRFDTGGFAQPNSQVSGYPNTRTGQFIEAERNSVAELNDAVTTDAQTVMWSGLESRYFACAIRPTDAEPRGEVPWRALVVQPQGPVGNPSSGIQAYPFQVGFQRPLPAEATTHSYEIFLGPKDKRILSAYADVGYPELINYGSLIGWAVRIFLGLLGIFHGVVQSWGLAIILLTVLVKLALHPLNKHNQGMMQRNQKKMMKIQPQMKELRERHKNDPMKANKEIQKLMRDNDVNPAQMFGGCLMMFLQMPIWIGLYWTFILAIELRHESFLYIADLTQSDRLFPLPFTIPILGWEYFNLLPVLYVVVTLINQRMMPRSDDPQAQQQQKIMGFMMVAFGFIFYNFASALLLYFLTNSGLGILEQRIIRAKLAAEEEAAAAASPPDAAQIEAARKKNRKQKRQQATG